MLNEPLHAAPVTRRGPPLEAACWVAGAAALAWTVLVFAPWVPAGLRSIVSDWGRTVVFAVATWFAWRAAAAQTESPPARLAWRLITLGFACVVAGDVVWGILEAVTGRNPQPSLGDGFLLVYPLFMLAGLLALPHARGGRREAMEFALDGTIVAVASGIVIWHLRVAPELARLWPEGSGMPALQVAYGVSDGLRLLALAMVAVRLPTGRSRLPILLLGASLLLSLSGGLLISAINLQTVALDRAFARLLWLAWGLLSALAALAAWQRAPMPQISANRPAWQPAFRHLPSITLVLSYGLLAPVVLRDPASAGSIMAGGCVLALLIAIRLVVSQRENDRLHAAEITRAGEARVAALVERASEALLVVGPALDIRYASPAARRLLAADTGATDVTLFASLHPDDAAAMRDYVQACARGQVRHATVTVRFGREPGPWTTAECSLSNLLGDPAVDGIVINARDVSERHALEEQLRAQALRDPLTDLPNRALFLDRAAHAMRRTQSGECRLALALVDLDRFRGINDGLGHRIADQILLTAARRIAATLARSDSIARVGGDEFGLLLEDLRDEADLRERLDAVRDALSQPLSIEGHSVRLTASVGAAAAAGVTGTEALLRNADIALEHVRTEGGNAVELFRNDRHGRVVERLHTEAELPRLLEGDAFQLAFEPLLRSTDLAPAGLYVRLGWRDPQRDPAGMRAVLAAVGESAVAGPLGRWYVQSLGLDLRALHRVLPEAGDLHVRVRADALQLRDDDMIRRIAGILQRLDTPPQQLVIEVPESALSPVTGSVVHALHRLRALGIRLGLCRFGATQANFDLFDAFPFDTLSLASPLVARLGASDRPATLVRAVVSAGRSLGMPVLAPGVTTSRQLDLLKELGCDLVAGPWLGRPLRFEQLLPWLGARFAATRDAAERGSLAS